MYVLCDIINVYIYFSIKEFIMERLLTRWGKTLDKSLPLNDYPRPQLKRDSFLNLNGVWEFEASKKGD